MGSYKFAKSSCKRRAAGISVEVIATGIVLCAKLRRHDASRAQFAVGARMAPIIAADLKVAKAQRQEIRLQTIMKTTE